MYADEKRAEPRVSGEVVEKDRPTRAPLRLHFLDGLRGLAALYVVLYHEVLINDESGTDALSAPLQLVRAALNHGHYSVVFFIVLSGFSLMLAATRSRQPQLEGGLYGFMLRRARRILPPYYAALALSLGAIVAFQLIGPMLSMRPPRSGAALSFGSIVSHVLLVHNLRFDWAFLINAPMWSVATEWQIYIVFALVLLPSWRYLGAATTVLIACLAGAAPFYLMPEQANFYWACPWFLGSFALGMWAATLSFPSSAGIAQVMDKVPLRALTLLAGALVCLVAGGWWTLSGPLADGVVSVWAFLLICHFARAPAPGSAPSWLRRVLESRVCMALGGFSYSLYLVQHPLLRLCGNALQRLHLGRDANLLVQLFVLTPVLLIFARAFAAVFEKSAKRQPRPSTIAEALQP